MVTGIAILTAALNDWPSISTYHYAIAVYLAWFSSFTHVLAVMSLQSILQKSVIMFSLRLLGFSGLFILLVVAQSKSYVAMTSYNRPTRAEQMEE